MQTKRYLTGRELKVMRVMKGLKAWDVAAEVGIHPSKLSLIENERITLDENLAQSIEDTMGLMARS